MNDDLAFWKKAAQDNLEMANRFMLEGMHLRQGLEDVVNPLGYLKRYAEAQGGVLSGMAYSIANDLHFVQKIAADTLKGTAQTAGEHGGKK